MKLIKIKYLFLIMIIILIFCSIIRGVLNKVN